MGRRAPGRRALRRPGRSCNASSGTPAARRSSTSGARRPGICSAGLSTTGLPITSAPATMPHGIASGKFHGAITAVDTTRPQGQVLRSPGHLDEGTVDEAARRAGVVAEEIDRLGDVTIGLGERLAASCTTNGVSSSRARRRQGGGAAPAPRRGVRSRADPHVVSAPWATRTAASTCSGSASDDVHTRRTMRPGSSDSSVSVVPIRAVADQERHVEARTQAAVR